MTFPRFFIDRPIFAIVLSVLMMIGGIVSFFQLPLSEYPAVTPPTVQVTTAYPGANPDVIAQTVATPLEQAITGVEGMLYMSSQSATDGRMILTITFDQHIDPDMAQIQVQNRVSRVLSRLPDEVQRQGVVTQKTSPDILMVVHLLSPEQRYDPLYISNYAYLQVRDELLLEFEKLHGEYGLKLQESLAGSPQLLEEAAQASRETLKSLGQLFEDRVIVAETLDTPWTQFYDQVSVAMDKTYQLDDAVLGYLDTQLQKRLQQVRTQMLLLVAALAVVFAAILYLYGGFYVSTRATLKDLGRMMERVAGGDMTVSFQARSRDELGELGQSFNESVAKIHDLIERVSQTVGEVERQTLRVESVSAESNQAVAGQRSQIEQVATAMNQMAATAQEVARSAAMAVSSANSVNQETLSGRSLVESQVGSIQRLAGEIDQSVAAINRLASDSASISQVLDVIKGIAEQTNLLALNAAIEAARAGEQGRGFAVVADEVRTLAKRTQQSTAEIEQMILRLQGGVDAAVKAMGSSHHTADGTVNESAQVQQALENILGAVGMIVDQNQQIAAAAEQQTAVAHDIDQNIVEINQAGERTAEGASQTERASRELGAQVTQLKRLIGAFRV